VCTADIASFPVFKEENIFCPTIPAIPPHENIRSYPAGIIKQMSQ